MHLKQHTAPHSTSYLWERGQLVAQHTEHGQGREHLLCNTQHSTQCSTSQRIAAQRSTAQRTCESVVSWLHCTQSSARSGSTCHATHITHDTAQHTCDSVVSWLHCTHSTARSGSASSPRVPKVSSWLLATLSSRRHFKRDREGSCGQDRKGRIRGTEKEAAAMTGKRVKHCAVLGKPQSGEDERQGAMRQCCWQKHAGKHQGGGS